MYSHLLKLTKNLSFIFLLFGCHQDTPKNTMNADSISLHNKSKSLISKSIGVWSGGKQKFNYRLVDSGGYKLFKFTFPEYEITDTAKVSNRNDETIIKLKNHIGKEHYKITILGDLLYYNDLGKPYQTYYSIED